MRILLGKLIRRLRDESKPGDLTLSQLSVLSRLERDGPTTLTAIAKAEGVRTQSAGATASNLMSMNLISGDPDPNDGRQTILSATDEGKELIRVNRAARETWLVRAIDEHLTHREQEEIASALQLLERLVQS